MDQQVLNREHELRDGDLVVARKSGSALDRLIGLTDDPFHHIAIVATLPTETGPEQSVVEFTFDGCQTRTLRAFVENYDEVGALVLNLTTPERQRIREVATAHLETTPRYAWDEIFLTGMNAFSRNQRDSKLSLQRGRFLAALESAIYRRNRSTRRAVFCTTFVLHMFDEAGVANPFVLGPIAPPPNYEGPDLSPKVRDRSMGWSLAPQIAINVVSFAKLMVRSAVTAAVPATVVSAPTPLAISSPSDFWRHVPAAGRVLL